MIGLLIALLIGCLVIWCIRLLLPMTGLPANAQTVIVVIIGIILLLWLLGRYAPTLGFNF
jgi:hypothetical protein